MEPDDNNIATLQQTVAGLTRRVRLLETGHAPRAAAPARPGLIEQIAGESWQEWARRHGWSLVYLFVAAADLIGAVAMRDWMLGVAALTMIVFAWLAWDSADA